MILSASSVMLFLNSNIKGLPMKVSEDMAARLTDEEVDRQEQRMGKMN